MNQVHLVGRLTKAPEVEKVGNGVSRLYITLAVDGYYDRERGEMTTDFIPVTVWGKLAERMGKAVKGSLLWVTGRVSVSSYEKNGRRQWKTEIVAEDFGFLAKPKGANGQ